jgi:hypothetical protein
MNWRSGDCNFRESKISSCRWSESTRVVWSFAETTASWGERIERQVLIRYGHGTYVIWDPEFQLVKTASTVDQALDAVETILKADPATSTTRWRRRFRDSWKKRLKRLATPGNPAVLELRADQAGFSEL